MKNINTYITEKLHLNKDIKINDEDKYKFIKAKDLEDLKNYIHNDWDGKSSFRISNKISDNDLDELCDYVYELEKNEGNADRIDCWYDNYNDDEKIFIVKEL